MHPVAEAEQSGQFFAERTGPAAFVADVEADFVAATAVEVQGFAPSVGWLLEPFERCFVELPAAVVVDMAAAAVVAGRAEGAE